MDAPGRPDALGGPGSGAGGGGRAVWQVLPLRSLVLEKQRPQRRLQGTRPAFPAPAAGPGAGLAVASGAGNFVRRHEARVPEGPECHAAVRPDHQVRDAAVVEGEAEPAFRRELQRPGQERAV